MHKIQKQKGLIFIIFKEKQKNHFFYFSIIDTPDINDINWVDVYINQKKERINKN